MRNKKRRVCVADPPWLSPSTWQHRERKTRPSAWATIINSSDNGELAGERSCVAGDPASASLHYGCVITTVRLAFSMV